MSEGLVLLIVLAANTALAAAVVRHGRGRAAAPSAAYLRIVGVAAPRSRLHDS